MIFKLALRNIIGYGLRSWINIGIIALVMIGMIWMQAMYAGWMNVAKQQMRDWDIGDGKFLQRYYDRFDSFTWDDSHAEIHPQLRDLISQNNAVPILQSSAVIYPEGRMEAVQLKGIPWQQTVLKIPTSSLKPSSDSTDVIPALIGEAMAKSASLKLGDRFTVRWKDAMGSYNAADVEIVSVMHSPVAAVDAGQIWIDLKLLQRLKLLPDQASQIVVKTAPLPMARELDANWRFADLKELMADLNSVNAIETRQQYIFFALLLFLAMIAIFDTQVLALFKRRKEIGTLAALGMTQRQIIRLFTLEGILYMVFAIGATAVLGFPLFWYFAVYGYQVPMGSDTYGLAGLDQPILFQYTPGIIIGTLLVMFVFTTFVSWLPVLRIAKLRPTDALRGRTS